MQSDAICYAYRQPATLLTIEDNPLLPQLLLEQIDFRSLEVDDLLLLLVDTCSSAEYFDPARFRCYSVYLGGGAKRATKPPPDGIVISTDWFFSMVMPAVMRVADLGPWPSWYS